ncbi:MAG: hypothetical protein JSW48_07825 [Betaproteobacteria bacterium]|jgi:5'(3')-deoxyribonucleotidase|nr:MAG: hypothetical protein JSW48_07825 [Betaproteobacteria bacterium]
MVTKEIYLDLDGVCVDLYSAAIAAHGLDPNEMLSKWGTHHQGEFYPYRVLDMDKDAFWDRITELGRSFWAELEPFPWFEALYGSLEQHGHVVFCSSANRSPDCLSGKLLWLQARFGHKFNEYVFTFHKDRLAHPSAYLIDDFELNVSKFRQREGNGILFPQIWNANHMVEIDRLEYVLDRLSANRNARC